MPTIVDTKKQFLKRVSKLAKKYRGLLDDVDTLIAQLKNDERPGDRIPNIGQDIYKVRLANPSAQKGKSGGFRVIYYVRLTDRVVLLTIYAKSDQPDISIQEIMMLLEDLPNGDESDEG
ncbi:MAG: type II toxin-antitoxin system RelE/ParE family toxin [Anaerolineae bacterium]|nr:type II toxin-antitoxin system RelE/ParE family toxin [Anaerolineae bacterium]